jgi:hypothetical protein
MADLKAFAFAAQLSQPATGFKATIQDFTLDKNAFDPTSISKTFASASKLGASIDTSLYKSTKDEDLTYTGDDGIVWDRVNAERLRRSLSGLPTPRPKEPPLVPAGPTPPKDPQANVPLVKAPTLEPPTASVTSTKRKKAVFDKDLDEPIHNPFVKTYYTTVLLWEKQFEQYGKLFDNPEKGGLSITKWVGDSANYAKLVSESKKIIEKGTDAVRTPEETLILKQRQFYRGIALKYDQIFNEWQWVGGRYKEVAGQYNVLRQAFMSSKTFGDLPVSVESAVMGSVPADVKKFVTNCYLSYAEFAKANPDLDKPPTA